MFKSSKVNVRKTRKLIDCFKFYKQMLPKGQTYKESGFKNVWLQSRHGIRAQR